MIIYYYAFHSPDGETLFCIINVCRLCCQVKNYMALFTAKNNEDASSTSGVIS